MKKNVIFLFHIPILFLFILLLTVSSCINPLITELDIIQIEDSIPPELTLISPVDNGYYAAFIFIEGVVSDMAKKNIQGKISALTYEVVGTDRHEEIVMDTDGSFFHRFPSEGLNETITFKVTAIDWNNNATVISLTLHRGAFPTFTVVPANREAILTWDPVPLAQGYVLYYTNDGSYPLETNPSTDVMDNVESPHILSNLKNGLLYSFMLKAVSSEGPDNYSDILQAIPLCSLTLAPRVTGSYGSIKVEWKDIPGTERYIVQRDSLADGSFSVSSDQLNDSVYIDTDVSPGQGYYYRVIPADQSIIPSGANYGSSSPFPRPATLASTETTPNHATDIVLQGDYAYIADWGSGLQVISIADPLNPFNAGSLDTTGNARGICLDNGYAYIADDNGDLKIVNIASPGNPQLEGTCDLPGNSCDVAVSGDYAYVAADTAGLHIVDITDKGNPSLVGTYNTDGEARGVAVQGDYAYVADGFLGLVVVDISTPDAPAYHSSYSAGYNYAQDILLDDTTLYMAYSEAGVYIFDISNLSNPSDTIDTPGTATQTAVYGDYLYIADDESGFHIYNISGNSPILVDSYEITGRALGCASDGEYGYIAYDQAGLHIINTATPAGLEQTVTFSGIGDVQDLVIRGEYAYIADNSGSVRVVDITHPGSPVTTGSCTVPGRPEGIEISVDYAFITGGMNIGLQIVNIANPANPEVAGWYDYPNLSTSAFISGEYAYITFWNSGGTSGMEILNIADIGTPESAGILESTDHHARDVFINGNTAYIADENSGLFIANISDLFVITKDKTCDTPEQALRITSGGQYLYIADGLGGLQIIDPAMVPSPGIIGAFDTQNNANDIELHGDYVYIADGFGGVQVIDIAEPDTPVTAGLYDPNYNIKGIAVSGSYAYAAAGTNGLIVLDLFPWD